MPGTYFHRSPRLPRFTRPWSQSFPVSDAAEASRVSIDFPFSSRSKSSKASRHCGSEESRSESKLKDDIIEEKTPFSRHARYCAWRSRWRGEYGLNII